MLMAVVVSRISALPSGIPMVTTTGVPHRLGGAGGRHGGVGAKPHHFGSAAETVTEPPKLRATTCDVKAKAGGIRQTVEFFARLCGTSGCVSESQDKPSGLAPGGYFPVRV